MAINKRYKIKRVEHLIKYYENVLTLKTKPLKYGWAEGICCVINNNHDNYKSKRNWKLSDFPEIKELKPSRSYDEHYWYRLDEKSGIKARLKLLNKALNNMSNG